MSEHAGVNFEQDQPWPWGPAEEYLQKYEQYLIGAVEEEPDLPAGLSAQDLEYIADHAEFLDFQADNSLWFGGTAEALDIYEVITEIRNLPEAQGHDS